jgi:hypothetical protein
MKKETIGKKIDEMVDRIVEEALRIVKEDDLKDKIILSDFNQVPWCSSNCISCLAAEARSNIEESFDLSFMEGDVAMITAKYILLEKLDGWEDN